MDCSDSPNPSRKRVAACDSAFQHSFLIRGLDLFSGDLLTALSVDRFERDHVIATEIVDRACEVGF